MTGSLTLSLRAYFLPDLESVKAMVLRTASRRLTCPSIWFALQGQASVFWMHLR